MHPEDSDIEETKPAAVKQFDPEIIGRRKYAKMGVYLLPGQHHGDIRFCALPDNAVDCSELLAQSMAKEEQERIESLVLGG